MTKEEKTPWVVKSKMSLRGACLHATWQSQQNKLIGRDPHVSPLDFLRMTIKKYVQKIGMALFGGIFSLFLLFPNPSYSAICFLPDCHLDEEPKNVGVDAEYCEAAGYTYSASGACPANQAQDTCIFNPNYIKCDGTEWCYNNGYVKTSCISPKVLDTACPSNGLLYKYCVCPNTYKYGCTGTGYSGGSGTAYDGKYTACTCAINYTWSGSACTCESSFKYSCSGTGYNGGSGTSCNSKYTACNCASGYEWNGSACTQVGCSVGMIYYSDKTCSNTYNSNKTAIGVVIKNNALIMSIDIVSISWASGYIDTALNNMSSPNAQADMNGKNNTSIIVSDYPNDTANNNAAVYCNKHTIAGTSFEQWYLPSLGELNRYISGNYNTIAPVYTDISEDEIFNLGLCSSSESDYYGAWSMYFDDGTIGWLDKNDTCAVACFLDISST